MLPVQQAEQLYGVGTLGHSVRLLLQLQLEQSLHLGQLKSETQSSVKTFSNANISVQIRVKLLHGSESSRDLSVSKSRVTLFNYYYCVVRTALV